MSRWLYFTKWDVQKAYKAIHDYYDFKAQNPQWFANLDDLKSIKDIFIKEKPRYILKKRDVYGRVILVHYAIDGFDKYPNFFFDIVQLDDYMFEAILCTANGQKCGITNINDFQG